MRAASFEDKLRTQWQSLQKQLGPFQRQLDVRTEVRGAEHVGIVSCQFSTGRADAVVIFKRGGGIVDLSMTVAP